MKLVLIIPFIFFSILSFTQQADNDTLTQCEVYYNQIKTHYPSDIDSSLYYLDKAISTCDKKTHPATYQKASLVKAQILVKLSRLEEAMEATQLCLEVSPETMLSMKCLNKKADIYQFIGKSDSSLVILKEVLANPMTLADTTFLANLYSSIGIAFEITNQQDSAVHYHLLSTDLYKLQNDTEGVAYQLANIAAFYIDQKDYSIGRDYAKQGLAVHNQVDAAQMLLRVRIAYSQYKLGDTETAIELYEGLIEDSQKINETRILYDAQVTLAGIYIELNQLNKAQEIYDTLPLETLLANQQVTARFALGEMALIKNQCNEASKHYDRLEELLANETRYELMSEYYRGLGLINACKGESHQLVSALIDTALFYTDSVYHDKKRSEFKNLDAKYRANEKQDSIQLLEQTNLAQSLSVKYQRVGLLAMLLLLLLAGLILQALRKGMQRVKSRNDTLIFEKDELRRLNQILKSKVDSITPTESKMDPIVSIKSLDKVHNVNLSEVLYAKAEDDGVRIFYAESSLWLDITLKKFGEFSSAHRFVKIYRSTIVNAHYIVWVNHETLLLKGDIELKIGRTFKTRIKEMIRSKN